MQWVLRVVDLWWVSIVIQSGLNVGIHFLERKGVGNVLKRVYVSADQLQDVKLVKGKSYQNKERFGIED
jgi:hypothetical protein